MARNVVICCDGTNNQFGRDQTNVMRLVKALASEPALQCVYYDPGVGTLPEPGRVSALGRRLSLWAGLAFGAGVSAKVAGAYSYLMQTWEPGDKVFLFGFSRGAYTVRALAAMLHMYGLLPPGQQNLLPYLMRQFNASRRLSRKDPRAYWRFVNGFRSTFARDVPGQANRRFCVHFLGAWDTVSSLGWIWDPVSYPYTAGNPSVATVRHAVSIDERRAFFRQNLFQPGVKGQDLIEIWFAGVHCDVGGGYSRRMGALWRVAFEWMVESARTAGLHVDDMRLAKVLEGTPATRVWAEQLNQSLTIWWWPAEVFPKLTYRQRWSMRVPRLNLWRVRELPPGALLHESVRSRVAESTLGYAPSGLRRLLGEDATQPSSKTR